MTNLRAWCQSNPTIFEAESRQRMQTHAGLWLDRYVQLDPASSSVNPDDSQMKPRTLLVNEVANQPIPEMYRSFYQRWLEILKDYGAQEREAQVTGRLAIDLGSESVIETSIALHHTYGTPYLPGSALKGLASSYLRYKLGLLEKQVGKEDLNYKQLYAAQQIIFGNSDEAGYITFFDALFQPASAVNAAGQDQPLQPDIITVHHPNYYQGNQPPDDRQSPIPVPFLSATGRYLLALAAPDLEQNAAWITFTFDLLAQALHDWGIGAKTSSGYGRMSIDGVPYIPPAPRPDPVAETPPVPPVDTVALRIEGYTRELNALPNNSSINGRLDAHYKHWQEIKDHPQSKDFALAIITKVRLAGSEKKCRERPWYKELCVFIG